MNSLSQKKQFLIVLAVAVLFGSSGLIYLYSRDGSSSANPVLEAEKEREMLVAAVGKLMELPQNEVPIIATIFDKVKLAEQPFFNNAQNGDKLLAYNAAQVVILYRPETEKIINVATIQTNNPEVTSEGNVKTDAEKTFRVAYYNGTDEPGLAKKTSETVEENYPQALTVITANASKKPYDTTLVVDLSGTRANVAASLAALLGGTVGQLPENEATPDADILIITAK